MRPGTLGDVLDDLADAGAAFDQQDVGRTDFIAYAFEVT
jgi:hypothetical protein